MDVFQLKGLEIRQAVLEDWPLLVRAFEEFKKSKHGQRSDIDLINFKKFFVMNLTNRLVCVLMIKYQDDLIGFMILYELSQPSVDVLVRRTFIHLAAWLDIFGKIPLRICKKIGDITWKAVEYWGALRRHDGIIAHTRVSREGANNYKFRAVEHRYGMKPTHVALFKRIPTLEELQKEEK